MIVSARINPLAAKCQGKVVTTAQKCVAAKLAAFDQCALGQTKSAIARSPLARSFSRKAESAERRKGKDGNSPSQTRTDAVQTSQVFLR